MGLAFIAPLFLAGLLALAIPVIVHLIRRHQGKRIDFPSLMFLRQMPVRSVRRLRIRDWFLLMLRALALALIVLAFARPVLRLGATDEVVEDGLREVVIALDRSWSMERGDRWERALDEARSVLADLVSPDRVSLVVFDGVGQVVVEPTLEPGRVRAALDTLSPGWGRTQIGAGIQAASGLVEPSERSRKEVVLISDFQRRGWEDGPRDRLPAGTQLTPVDVGTTGSARSWWPTWSSSTRSSREGSGSGPRLAWCVRARAHPPRPAWSSRWMDGRSKPTRSRSPRRVPFPSPSSPSPSRRKGFGARSSSFPRERPRRSRFASSFLRARSSRS